MPKNPAPCASWALGYKHKRLAGVGLSAFSQGLRAISSKAIKDEVRMPFWFYPAMLTLIVAAGIGGLLLGSVLIHQSLF